MQSSCEHPAIASQSLGSYSVLCHYDDSNTRKRGRTKFAPFTETLKPIGLFGFLFSVAYIGLGIVAVACCPSVLAVSVGWWTGVPGSVGLLENSD